MRSATQKPGVPMAVYTLRVEREKLDLLREIAASEHRTLSQELRRMIDERITRGTNGTGA